MGTHRLVPHPDSGPGSVAAVAVRVTGDGSDLCLRYQVRGGDALSLPAAGGRGRADGLWRTTCFELFVQAEGALGYIEFNFSPSGRWAAYTFADYRQGMRDLPLRREPACVADEDEGAFVLDVRLPAADLPPPPWTAGLSAVLDEAGGAKSFWALAHPPGRPDFHHPACFALALAPPPAA